jgi:hypothetical protein
MSYNVDKTFAWDGIYQYSSDSGAKYLVKISKTSKNSDMWTLNFMKLAGEPSKLEVFKIMRTLWEVSMEYVNEKNINTAILLVSGADNLEIEQKTTVFTRYLKDDWDFQIINNPDFQVEGMKNGKFSIPTNAFFIQRKVNSPQIINKTIDPVSIKFCFNCGTKNDSFQFCPNCGTKF